MAIAAIIANKKRMGEENGGGFQIFAVSSFGTPAGVSFEAGIEFGFFLDFS
jgi:hypothetical protein